MSRRISTHSSLSELRLRNTHLDELQAIVSQRSTTKPKKQDGNTEGLVAGPKALPQGEPGERGYPPAGYNPIKATRK